MKTRRVNTRNWSQLQEILDRVSTSGLRTTPPSKLRLITRLYRRAVADMSLLRARPGPATLLEQVTALVNRAHPIVYQAPPVDPFSVVGFIGRTFPQALRRHARMFWAAMAVMAVFCIAGSLISVGPGHTGPNLIPPPMLRQIDTDIRARKDLGLAARIPPETRYLMSSAIIGNNVRVSALSYVVGLAGGVFTFYLLSMNGFLLGAVARIYFVNHYPMYFMAGVLPHGVLELPAIGIASAGGMSLGFALLFPGKRRRGHAVREAARDSVVLLLGAAMILVAAGLIEGFVTPLTPKEVLGAFAFRAGKAAVFVGQEQMTRAEHFLYLIKISFSGVMLFALTLYATAVGRTATKGASKD